MPRLWLAHTVPSTPQQQVMELASLAAPKRRLLPSRGVSSGMAGQLSGAPLLYQPTCV